MLVTGNPEATAELERLIEVGQERGSLSTGEVAEILQETGLDPTQLEELLAGTRSSLSASPGPAG